MCTHNLPLNSTYLKIRGGLHTADPPHGRELVLVEQVVGLTDVCIDYNDSVSNKKKKKKKNDSNSNK